MSTKGLRPIFELEWVGGYTHTWNRFSGEPGVPAEYLFFCLLDATHMWRYMPKTEAQLVRDPARAMLTSEGLVCPDCFFSRRHGTEGMARTRSDQ